MHEKYILLMLCEKKMSKHIIIFSIAFIFILCLFWMQIQIGRCADDLDVWMSSTKQESNQKAGHAFYETENEYATRRHNMKMKYQNDLKRTSFDVESNQDNELEEMVNVNTGKSYSPLNMSVPDQDWLPEERKRTKGIPYDSIRSSNEKVFQTSDSKESTEHSKFSRPITSSIKKHKKDHSHILNGTKSTKRGVKHPPVLEKHKKTSEKMAQNKEIREKYKSEERTPQLKNTPPVRVSIYEQGKVNNNSDAESDATDDPANKTNYENFASQELNIPFIESKTRTENFIEAEQEYKAKSTTESLTEPERAEETEKNALRENKKPKIHYKNKSPARSGKKSVSKKIGRQNYGSPQKRASSVASLKYLAPHSLNKQLECLAKKYESKAIIDQEVIGRTVEYNDIILWKIRELPDNRKGFKHKTLRNRAGRGSKYADDKPEKKIVFIIHGLNVMGWHKLKCLSEVKSFETLLGYYLDNLDCFDIYLIPMANPDGVQISASQGYWNKNVSPQKACPGVNLDRNFDVGWNASYTKMSSCSQQYPGPRALSERETKAIRNVFNLHGHKMIAFFHVHSSTYDTTTFRGDAVLYPKGYTDSQTDDDRYIDFKGELDEAMRNTSFKVLGVTVDTLHSWYGKVIGTSVDYASAIFGIPYAFDFSMQIYDDDTMVTMEEDREQNTALVELWQIVIDIAFSHIHNTTDKVENNS